MKAAWSGMLGLFIVVVLLTACKEEPFDIRGPRPDTAGDVRVTVSPDTATLVLGGTRQLQAVAIGTTSQGVLWSSSAETIATVNDAGLVTGRSVGVAVITAVSQVDSRARDTTVVNVITPHSAIVITQITRANTDTPLQPHNISGSIDVIAEFFVPQGYPIQRIDFLLDNVVLPSCTQTFQAGSSAELAAAGAMVPVRCTIHTAAVNPTTGAPIFPNGPHRVSVHLIRADGVIVSSSSQDVTFNNP